MADIRLQMPRCPASVSASGPFEGPLFTAQLNSLKAGLTQSIKLSQIVRKIQKPYGFQTPASFLCAGTHLSQYGGPRGAPLLPRRGPQPHLSPVFMLYAQNYEPRPSEQKRSIKAQRNWPKTLRFCGILVFFSSQDQICVSHINLVPEWGSTSEGQEATTRI